MIVEATYRVGHQEQLYIENNAMIALPREDGGITVHGSLQCPYYVHKALRAGLDLDDAHTQVVQAETGGGFGGKEEYPSMIALHASLLARKTGRPVRMIYDRHEDLSATTKRHPAVIRYRTGVRRDGTIVAQDIDLVMDGGAYTTLTPVVLSRGTIHAGGPYDVANVRIRSRAVATNTPPNGAFRGFGAPAGRVRGRDADEPRRRRDRPVAARDPPPERLPARRRRRPPSQLLRDDAAAIEVLDRAAEASEFERVRARTSAERDARRPGDRTARGVGLALAWHGAGFTGSGEEKMGSVASLERTGDGRIRILTASTEMGQGTKTIFPQLVAAELGIDVDDVEMAPQDTAFVPDSGPTVASRTAMVVGGLLIDAARRLKAEVEGRTGRPFGLSWRDDATAHGDVRIDERFTPYAGRTFDDATYSGDAYPTFGWAAAVAEVEVDLDTAEVAVLSVVAVDDVGRVIHPILCEGQVEGGTLQAVGYATIEEIKLLDGRYLNDRLRRTSSRPRSMRRGSTRSSSRRRSRTRRTTRRASASCRWTSGRPRWSRRSTTRPGPGSTTCRRPRSASWPRWPGSTGRRARRVGGLVARRRPRGPTPDDLSTDRQRRAGGGRRARDAATARRAARGPRADRHQGGLRRGRVRGLYGPRRRRGGRQLPRPRVPGRRVRRADGGGPRGRRRRARPARTTSRTRSSSRAGRSAGSARPGC